MGQKLLIRVNTAKKNTLILFLISRGNYNRGGGIIEIRLFILSDYFLFRSFAHNANFLSKNSFLYSLPLFSLYVELAVSSSDIIYHIY
jgi:hypothetical protein